MTRHGMVVALEQASANIMQRAPEDNAKLFMDAAACIETLWIITKALREELAKEKAK